MLSWVWHHTQADDHLLCYTQNNASWFPMLSRIALDCLGLPGYPGIFSPLWISIFWCRTHRHQTPHSTFVQNFWCYSNSQRSVQERAAAGVTGCPTCDTEKIVGQGFIGTGQMNFIVNIIAYCSSHPVRQRYQCSWKTVRTELDPWWTGLLLNTVQVQVQKYLPKPGRSAFRFDKNLLEPDISNITVQSCTELYGSTVSQCGPFCTLWSILWSSV